MKHLRVLGVILSMMLAVGCVAQVQTPEGEPQELMAQADALLEQGQAADAIPLLEAALAQEDSAEGRFLLGNAYSQIGRSDDAEAEYLRALDLDPDYVDARANLAVVYYEAGRLAEAEEAARHAIEAHPNDADLHYNLGGVLAAQERFAEAEAEFLIARDLDPDLAEVHLGLGMLYHAQGRNDEALDALRRFLETSDDPEWRAQAEALIASLEEE